MDPLDVLGLPNGASDYEIRQRYLQLAGELRPRDLPGDRERLQDLNRAYQALQHGHGAPASAGDSSQDQGPTAPPDPFGGLPPTHAEPANRRAPDPSPPGFGRRQPGHPRSVPPSWTGQAVHPQASHSPGPGGRTAGHPATGTGTGLSEWPWARILMIAAYVIVAILALRLFGFFAIFPVFFVFKKFSTKRRHRR